MCPLCPVAPTHCAQVDPSPGPSLGRPDVVLADFATPAGAELAKEMSIPLVINLPGSVTGANVFTGMADASTAINFLGLHIARQRLSVLAFARWANVKLGRPLEHVMCSRSRV